MVQPMVARSSPARGRVANDALKAAPDHRGEARAFDVELFAAPPPEIGTITSAESTLRPGKEPFSPPVRLLILLLPAAAVFGIVWVLTQGMRPVDRESLRIIGGGGAAGVALLIAWYYTRFKHRCTYVGEDGAALFELRGSRDRTPSAKVLRFADAAELRASQTRQFINGVYAGTVYDFRWTDASGRERLRLKGTHRGKDGPPKPGDPFHFATAAEVAWSVHYLARAQEQLEREG